MTSKLWQIFVSWNFNNNWKRRSLRKKLFLLLVYQSSLSSSHLKLSTHSQLTRYCGNEFQSGTMRLPKKDSLWVQFVKGSLSRRLLWPRVAIALCGLHAIVVPSENIMGIHDFESLNKVSSFFGVLVFWALSRSLFAKVLGQPCGPILNFL